jgi:hypothetical protein
MTSLLDVADLHEQIEIRGQQVSVKGISVIELMPLLQRFPEFRAMLSERKVDMTPERMFSIIPEVVVAVIALATARDGEDVVALERAASHLTVGEQVAVLRRVFDLTLPLGLDNLVQQIEQIAGAAGEGDTGTAQDTSSPRR